ncbi:MAG: alpha-mannosidase [Phycisphaerae bacterium]|nr:alpha-mannosidase [Phycisphaerae bacterium]
MGSEQDIRKQFVEARLGVKRKFRGIANFHERAQMRFDVILDAMFPTKVPLDEWKIRRAYYRNVDEYEWVDDDWWTIRFDQEWGGPNYTAFFRRTAEVPKELDGKPLALRMFVQGDGLLRVDGKPHHALDPFRFIVPLTDKATAGRRYELELETYINWHGGDPGQRVQRPNVFELADLASLDRDVWNVYWDLKAAEKLLDIPDVDEGMAAFVEHHLWEAMKLIPLQQDDPAARREAILAAGRAVRESIYRAEGYRIPGRMNLVGHSHLDIVYMWPYREYVRKIGRTHSTQLRLMEQYPQLTFCQSQAKLYADMKAYWPELYRQVQQRVAEGRWEPIGAFWVEPDCNLISGESLVRQVFYGQRFWQDEFEMTSRTCWQPDVFGMSWAMPQILARSGVEYVMTNKMVPWNDTNPWTLNTFHWQGVDGTKVMGIVPPGHFIGTVDPDDIHTQWRGYSDKATIGETVHIFGWGDGGGGPDPEEIESALRYRDFIGMPEMAFTTCEQAFDRIRDKAADVDLPVWRDEIYLEAHRGTFTNKGRLKKLNRRMEYLCREAEMTSALAWLSGADYPAERIETSWKDLLVTQFHDAVPGTHTTEVYGELLTDYERIASAGEAVRDEALRTLIGDDSGDMLAVLNSLTHERSDAFSVPAALLNGRSVLADDGGALPQQDITDLDGTERVLVCGGAVPGVGYRTFALGEASPAPSADAARAEDRALENEHLRAEFNDDGELVRLLDKDAGREVLPTDGVGNRFCLFEDTPGRYDAWDLVDTYRDHPIDIAGGATLTIDEQGPVRASLRLERPIANSHLVQRISLSAASRQLTFETQVDWKERQRILKVAFPVDVNTTQATYDMAYGNIARPCHRNTSYDAARFEVCGHEWMDMSQGDYGVTLLNDGKYGHEAMDKMMRLSLLKGSIKPDPQADLETHTFTYAIMPHAGTWVDADVQRRSRELNAPMHARLGGATAGRADTLLSCDAPGMTLEAVKRAEDGDDLIVRLVERCNRRVRGTVTLPVPVAQAWSCDLMERKEALLGVDELHVPFEAGPYEIVTLRIRPASRA